METKTKKAQVVIAVADQESQKFQFLLLQTNEKRGKFWQNITGKIEHKETFEEGALREAIEETGLSIESILDIHDLDLSYYFTDQHGRRVHEKCFLIILDQNWDVRLDPKEHMAYRWIDFEEVKEGVVKYSSNLAPLEKAKLILRQWGI
jgi:dihydroneopterin triphosphate diphosphatase